MQAPPAILRPAICVAALLWPAVVAAQVGGSILAETDYRYRGVSLSGEDPTLHLSLSYDHPAGWYAGASLAAVELVPGFRRAATTGYAGYVQRSAAGWAWEAGATVSHFSGFSGYDYGEAFAGVIGERWSARLYFSPDYFGRNARTLYGEVNGGVPISPMFRAFVHLGVLSRLSGTAPEGVEEVRYDVRAGIGARMGGSDLRLAWVAGGPGEPYVAAYRQRRSTAVLSYSFDF